MFPIILAFILRESVDRSFSTKHELT